MQQGTLMLTTTILAMLFAPLPAHAQGRAEGGVVIRDNAPIYLKSTGSTIVDTRMRGDYLVGVTTMFVHESYQFEDEDGRLHVSYFRDKDQKGMFRTAWMNPADLARFTYECGCGPKKEPCSPFSTQGFTFRWNTCFLEGKDRKLAEIKAQWEVPGAGRNQTAEGASPARSGEKPLTNDDIIAMTKAGLGDDIIVAKTQQATASFDTSADALIQLKKAGVGKAVMDAMLKHSSGPEVEKKAEPRGEDVGATRPSAVAVNGKRLLLNGSGLRRKMGVVMYAGELYLETVTRDASVVVGSDQTKLLRLRILFEQISKDQQVSALKKGFKENSSARLGALSDSIQRFLSWMQPVRSGDEIDMAYVPGAGITLSIAGEPKGTIEGKDFADALFSVWFGTEPVDADLKKGMLGQG